MSFVQEYPVSQELLNRFDWTALPLLNQGEAGMYCNIPHFVLIDHEQDLVYYTGGGGEVERLEKYNLIQRFFIIKVSQLDFL